MDSVETVVIGAGVVGLAIVRALAHAGREVLVLESEAQFGTQTSSRNSEVVHAGLYYPPGSLKARLCLEGKRLLTRFCAEHGVPLRTVGKLLIATGEAERSKLDALEQNAARNGVPLKRLSPADVHALEPEVKAIAGLWSSGTGIVDSHELMRALLADAEGATLVTRTPVLGGRVVIDGVELRCGGAAPMTLRCRQVINSAGLSAQQVAATIEGAPTPPSAYFAKGHYFSLRGASPFSHLVYPMPDQAGLGIHVTLDLAGACKFGPDVTRWLDAPDYAFEEGLEEKFTRAHGSPGDRPAHFPRVTTQRPSTHAATKRTSLAEQACFPETQSFTAQLACRFCVRAAVSARASSSHSVTTQQLSSWSSVQSASAWQASIAGSKPSAPAGAFFGQPARSTRVVNRARVLIAVTRRSSSSLPPGVSRDVA